MLIVGLTGSIGMGKSTVANCFRELGIAVSDADAVVHDLYAGAAAKKIEKAFPDVVIAGQVDRKKLSALLMAEPHRMKELEDIVHPMVRDRERQFLQSQAKFGAAITVLDVPLLFESNSQSYVDVTLVVTADPELQKARVLARPEMTEEKFEKLSRRQLPDHEKQKRADYVIDNNGTIEQTCEQVKKLTDELRIRRGRIYQRYWT